MTTYNLALFADPVAHSLSPLMHEAGLAYHQLVGQYQLIQSDATQLAEKFMQAVQEQQLVGANFSYPNKQKALTLADWVDPLAQWIGAANTLVYQNQRWEAYNTDGKGFLLSLEKERQQSIRGEKLCFYGCGGTAKAIMAQAAFDHIGQLCVICPKPQYYASTQRYLDQLQAKTGVAYTLYQREEAWEPALQNSYAFIQTTSLSLQGKSPVTDDFSFPKNSLIVDVNYQVAESRFLQQAKAQNCATLNGLGMLFFQGDLAFQKWTGQTLPYELIYPQMEVALQERETYKK